MKITKSAPIFGTRSHRYSSFNYEWQGKKNPHAEQGTGIIYVYSFRIMEVFYIAFGLMISFDF